MAKLIFRNNKKMIVTRYKKKKINKQINKNKINGGSAYRLKDDSFLNMFQVDVCNRAHCGSACALFISLLCFTDEVKDHTQA